MERLTQGDYCLYDGGIIKMEGFYYKDYIEIIIEDPNNPNLVPLELGPLPITKDLLEKARYLKKKLSKKGDSYCLYSYPNTYAIEQSQGDYFIYITGSDSYLSVLKSFAHLQQIIRALTNIELELID